MFRFTIRDVLWLTVVVAMGLGWFLRDRQLLADNERARKWRMAAGALEKTLSEDGWTVTWGYGKGEVLLVKEPEKSIYRGGTFVNSSRNVMMDEPSADVP